MVNLTLQKKFIAFLLITLLLALILNGFLILQLFASRSGEINQQKLSRAFEELHEELSVLQQHTLNISHNLVAQKEIISSINLINRYQDVMAYQPLIFDVEKEKLARGLALQMRSVDIDMAIIYDLHGEIVAFYLNNGGQNLSGYTSYEHGERRIMATSALVDEFSLFSEPLPTILLTAMTDYADGATHAHLMVNQQSLFNTSVNALRLTPASGPEQIIGRVVSAKEISIKALSSAIAHLGVEIAIHLPGARPTNQLERIFINENLPAQPTLDSSHISGHKKLTLIKSGDYLFSAAAIPLFNSASGAFIIGLKQEQIEQQLRDFRNATLIVLLITALFIIPLALYMMNRVLLSPLKLLTDGIHRLKRGEHVRIEGLSKGDELGELAHSFNTMVDVLKRREEQLRTLSMATEKSPISVIISSPEQFIEYVNPQFEMMSGYRSAELNGKPMAYLYQQSEIDPDKEHEWQTALSSKNRWSGELTYRNKEGIVNTLRVSISAIKDAEDSISHFVTVAEDITERKQNEELLRSRQKMDAIGQLTGGVAHDFNNILGIIMGNLELLKINHKDQPRELERIERALAGTRRGAQLTQKLLGFSRQDKRGQEVTQINQFIKEMHELITRSLTAVIQVETRLADDLWPVAIDPGDLEDAILNLSLNARDAMPDGGVLVIETANKQLDANYVGQHPGAHEGDYVMVSISDTGTGISDEVRKKMFDPFFTTKERGKGTGLGLSMVYGFVKRSGGHIELYSEPGKGTTFHIYIPRAAGEEDSLAHEQAAKPAHGNETILVVDDEENLADIAVNYLHELGYRTLVATNGQQALDILTNNSDIDLIFSDIVMPGGIDGYHLAFRALKQNPALKVLLTSGFTSRREEFSNGEQKIYQHLAENLLGKPYNLNELAQAIRRTLDK